MWRIYLAGSIAAFQFGTLQLFQVLFARPMRNCLPLTRATRVRASLRGIARCGQRPRGEGQRNGLVGSAMNRRCEVLVVGGGPGGSTCAGRLARAGVDVLVIDRKTFPRDKICAGWVTPQVFEVLGVDPAEFGRDHVCQPITGFRTGLIGRDEIATDYGRVVSYGIRRCEFDHFLLEQAGVECILGEAVTDLRRDGDGWIVNDCIHSSVIVGAGGHFCPVCARAWAAARETKS